MKILITILGLLNGCYMLADGVFVMFKGKFIGPKRPGPWANLFYKLDIDVFKLGPLFIIFGLVWLIWIFSIWTNRPWAYLLGILICVSSLWYIPIGAFFSIIIMMVLLLAKQKLRL
jgi:hypothetical protein